MIPIVPYECYTIVETKDQSHATAKWYSFKVLINGTLTKAAIVSVVRQVTLDSAKRNYHRNERAKKRWGDTDAHVVWTFVYPTLKDLDRDNFVCRSQWINAELPASAKPISLDGEHVGGDIVVDWNRNYSEYSAFWNSIEVTKEDYLDRALPLSNKLISLSEIVVHEFGKYVQSSNSESQFMQSNLAIFMRINEIDSEIRQLPSTPVECGEISQKLSEVISFASNIALLYSEIGMKKWNKQSRLAQAKDQAHLLTQSIDEFKYELKKVR